MMIPGMNMTSTSSRIGKLLWHASFDGSRYAQRETSGRMLKKASEGRRSEEARVRTLRYVDSRMG